MSEFNVLSLFDGMSCGQLALHRAGIKYDNYFASEVDKYAIKVTQANFPNTVQLGDVTQVKSANLPKIDLLIGGSPCQGFSTSGKGLNFSDPRSKLFFEFVRLFTECKPRYFLLENVKMKKIYKDIISSYMDVRPIQINSALVSAQNRVRLYWTNISGIKQPHDKGIQLKDIINFDDIIYNIPKNYDKYVSSGKPIFCDPYNKRPVSRKSTSLRTNINNGNVWVRVPNGYRNLSATECERLQTVPDGYTSTVSDAQARKMLGNGWTVDVIAHIFKNLNKKPKVKQPVGLFPLYEILGVNNENNSLGVAAEG